MALTFQQKLDKSAVQSVILAEITAAAPLEAWVAYNSIWRVSVPAGVTLASFEADGSAVTEGSSVANVEATAGRWFQSGLYVYFNPSSGTPYAKVIVAFCKFYYADEVKTLNSNYYASRLKSVPRLSLRIEKTIGGISQIGGGNIGLENTDGFFDSLANFLRWDNGTAVIKMGLDLKDSDEAYGDYRTIATYALDGADLSDTDLTIKVKERKEVLKTKLPLTLFDQATYPYIAQNLIGKPIPMIYGRVYGAKGIVKNPNTNTIKVCGHAIAGFIGLRVKETLKTRNTIAPDWFIVANQTYYRTAVTNDVVRVTYSGTDLTQADSIAAVAAGSDLWAHVDGFVYTKLTNPNVPTSANIEITIEVSQEVWREIPFATKDIANGEFTVSSEYWDGKAELSVDVLGKTSSGTFLQTSSEIAQDILTVLGETSFDTAAFAAAKLYFDMGADRFGNKRYHMKPSLYIDTEVEAIKIIERLNVACFTYLYVNASGQWSYNAIAPEPESTSFPNYDEANLISLRRDDDTDKIFTQVNATFAKYHAEDRNSLEIETSDKFLKYRGREAHIIKEVALDLWDSTDANYWAQRAIGNQAFPLVTYQTVIPRFGLVLAPGDKLRVIRTRGGVDEILEVLEIDFNLTTKQATLILGNVRGWGRSSGFWVADSQPDWDNTDTDLECKDAAAESGFWTDANGFADTTDARSFNVSRWW